MALALGPGDPPALDELVATLARESIDVAVVSLATALAEPAAVGAVLVAWAPSGLGALTFDELVAWGHRVQPPAGLIAGIADRDVAAAEAALRAGFDDAVGVGCSPRELAARIRAVHRRVVRAPAQAAAGAARRLTHRTLVLDPDSCELWLDGRAVALTLTEFTMLVALVRARGGVLSRAELLDQAWGGDSLEVGERAVDNVVLRLRRKVGRPELVQTVRGIGFRLGPIDEPDGE
ncbi:MAG: response regulator transcription factor [Myxococcales bacterium]|nr:response regulator transcription factor [Myxococcales bacterium]